MKKLPPEVLDYFRKEGSKGGKIGGKRAAETLTPEQRTERAKKAGAASAAARSKKETSKGAKGTTKKVSWREQSKLPTQVN